ncbi:transcription initiation factor IID, 18kD subunit-domain-containing protein [Gaertneriomyces semiglobifer]|nr:transcription initiation factor IID, 18kD subunit-domain-containing protein [Gaertneriomyces semiglobifer]
MMYVFGEVTEPKEETTVLVEEIVRSQVIEILVRAVQQASRRNTRFLSTEDLIFLIRHDRHKVNTLRTFLMYREAQKASKQGGSNAPLEQYEEEVLDEAGPSVVRKKVRFSWDLLTYYGSVLEDDDHDDLGEEEQQAYESQLARLRVADEITRTMSKEEYMYYSECRSASFTYKKVKRFREWCNMGTYYDSKPNDQVLDILGFLAYEMVQKLTEAALDVKRKWDSTKQDEQKRDDQEKVNFGLFARPTNERAPLEPIHIHEAFRRLQKTTQPMANFRGGVARTTISLI